MGVTAGPIAIDDSTRALAVARFFFVNHWPITFHTDAGKSPSPTPNKKRVTRSTASPLTMPVRHVNTVHHASAIRITLRGPRRSARRPSGIWKSAYPAKNALRIQPILSAPIARSLAMNGTAMLMAMRSSQATR